MTGNKKSIFAHSDDDEDVEDDEHHDSISDCDMSGNFFCFFFFLSHQKLINFFLLVTKMDAYRKQVKKHTTMT